MEAGFEGAANLAGSDIRNSAEGIEAEIIDNNIKEFWLNLRSNNVNSNSKTIDIGPQIDEILLCSKRGDGDVCLIGIKGPRGIGKTILGRGIFDRESSRFDGASFVPNVREVSESSLSGLMSLQQKFLSDVLIDERIIIHSVSEGKDTIKEKLGHRKVLVVLDDVDQIEQLQALAGAPTWFGKGSLIFITTRDEQILLQHGVNHIHRVPALSEEAAIHLFSWFAFGGDNPVEGYKQSSLEVVHCADGLPLAIKFLGILLRDKNEDGWRDVLHSLKVVPFEKTLESFELNLKKIESIYNSLEDDNKAIFLEVACFMKGLRKNDAIRILESCRPNARDGLGVLERKSLLTISDDHRLGMHDCIEYKGRSIVRRLHPNQPNQHSVLWIREEVEYVLVNDLGTDATRCIQLVKSQLSPDIVMEGVGRMGELKCLIVESENENEDLPYDWQFLVDRQYLPDALRFLRWVHYPFPSLPVTFWASNLVTLEMPDSGITRLWEDGERQVLNNLRFLDLSRSRLTALDLKLTPQLECLELKECHDLEHLGTSVGSLRRLFHLDLIGCSRFDSFSFIKRLESLNVLSLSKLHLIAKSLHEFSRRTNMSRLEFTCSYSEEVPSLSRCGLKFVSLNLQPRTRLESVLGSICGLQHLRHLTLEGCIPEVPKDIDQLVYLEKLDLVSTDIKCLPDSLCSLKHLKYLKFEFCLHLEELPQDLGRLECLEVLSLLSMRIRRLPDSMCELKHLKSLILEHCSLLESLPENLGDLKLLEKLNLLSASIKRLPDGICKLENLKSLELEACEFLERLPDDLGHLQRLSELNVKGTGISHLPQSISMVEDLRIVGSMAVLRSCRFASEIHTSEDESFCFILPWTCE